MSSKKYDITLILQLFYILKELCTDQTGRHWARISFLTISKSFLVSDASTIESVFQDGKLIVKAKSRPTGNIAVKATFHANGSNPRTHPHPR